MQKLQWFMDRKDAHGPRSAEPTTVPLGVAGFAGDFSGVRRFAERDHKNLVQWTMHPEPGGHYAAHLEPGASPPTSAVSTASTVVDGLIRRADGR